ncbi:hypothetical protein ACWEF6_02950 [Amycolatopsis sp. NPDC004772]
MALSVLAATLVTLATAFLGWATAYHDWPIPPFNFMLGVMIVVWVSIIAALHLDAIRRDREQAWNQDRIIVHAEHVTTRKKIKEMLDQQEAAKVATATRLLDNVREGRFGN